VDFLFLKKERKKRSGARTSTIKQEDDRAAGLGLEFGVELGAAGGLLVRVDDDAGESAAVVGHAEVADGRVVVAPDVLRRQHPHAALLHHEPAAHRHDQPQLRRHKAREPRRAPRHHCLATDRSINRHRPAAPPPLSGNDREEEGRRGSEEEEEEADLKQGSGSRVWWQQQQAGLGGCEREMEREIYCSW